MGVSPKKKSTFHPYFFYATTLLGGKPQSVLSSLTFLAGFLTYVCVSNVWRFHLHVTTEEASQRSSSSSPYDGMPALREYTTMTGIKLPHPAHAYLQQEAVGLPGLLNDDDNDSPLDYPTNIVWPFDRSSSTAVRILFVHVGKAGGMSLYRKIQVVDAYRILKCRMRNETRIAQDPCLPANIKKSAPMLRQRVLGQLHKATAVLGEAEETWIHQNANLLLFMVRDPLDRIVSAFNFQRHLTFVGDPTQQDHATTPYNPYVHRNQTVAAHFYNSCFRTIQHLAISLDPRRRTPGVNPACADWGLKIITGQLEVTYLEHFYYNYRTYAERAVAAAHRLSGGQHQKPWVVIRTNQLWQDTGRIEGLLGGNPRRFEKAEKNEYRITHGSEHYEISSGVDADGAVALCCLLWDDVRVYHALILGAINLNQAEKVETLQSVLRHCGIAKAAALTWPDLTAWSWHEWAQETCRPPIR